MKNEDINVFNENEENKKSGKKFLVGVISFILALITVFIICVK